MSNPIRAHILSSDHPQGEWSMSFCSCESFSSVDAAIARFLELKKDKTLKLISLEVEALGFEKHTVDGTVYGGPGIVILGEIKKLI